MIEKYYKNEYEGASCREGEDGMFIKPFGKTESKVNSPEMGKYHYEIISGGSEITADEYNKTDKAVAR